MLLRVLGLAVSIVLVAVVGNFSINFDFNKNINEEKEVIQRPKDNEGPQKDNARSPAAEKIAPGVRGTVVKTTARDDSIFGPEEKETPGPKNESVSSGNSDNFFSPAMVGTSPSPSGQKGPTPSRPSNKMAASSQTLARNSGFTGNIPAIPGTIFGSGKGGALGGGNKGGSTGEDGGGIVAEGVPVCTASTGSGSFSSPLNVSLSCSATSAITYCLSENTCCDPSFGSTYTGPIEVGELATTYCLSFSGTSVSGKTSNLSQNSYTFTSDIPDLGVSHPKLYYQTTQLRGLLRMASTDFGGESLMAGVINLKTHDPGPSGLDASCVDIVHDYAVLTFPSPSIVMADRDASLLSPSSQLNVYFTLPELQYGNNYLTTYLKNTIFANIVSCSTTNVMLYDFPYFDPQIAHGEVGSNSVREFSGGFTSVGFFEPEATVYRGPAGIASQDVSQQELRTGIFGVFY